MIEISDLTFHYPNQAEAALRGVSLRVAAGEFILLSGDSGSGKSTLLRCLNGLIPHMSGGRISGRVVVDGLDSIAAGPQQMSGRVGFVFQNPEGQAVLDRVEPEIAFGLENSAEFRPTHRANRQAQAQIRQVMQERVAETMDWLNLTGLRQRPLRTLSGGERQKVALAGTLALRPAVLALDEPTSQLDPAAAADLLDTLVRLNREQGLTIVLAEHRLERVLPFVDRVVYLENGQITLDAPTRQAAGQLPHAEHLPPVIQLGRWLGWEPLPLTVEEARPFWESGNWQLATGHWQPATDNRQPEEETAVLLNIHDLHFAYDRQPALQGVSLTVRAGQAVALLGDNGAGKTTLLKCITGLLQPGAGQITLNGQEIAGRSTADICRQAAYLPQNPDDLLFADSVAEECRITLRNHKLLVEETAVVHALQSVGLAGLADAYPRDLSVGQRQRVALAAVTMPQPDLILLDEPTRGLDAGAKAQLVAIWQAWLAQGKGLLLVTHDVELAAHIADQVIILQNGRVVADGTPSEVFAAQPAFAPQLARLRNGKQ
jgi:energy-coupling factor transport system ATP-binding protein